MCEAFGNSFVLLHFASCKCVLSGALCEEQCWAHTGISEQVKEKPVGVEILGEKVVLYRDSAGVIQCLHDVCPHRGAPLHKVQLSS